MSIYQKRVAVWAFHKIPAVSSYAEDATPLCNVLYLISNDLFTNELDLLLELSCKYPETLLRAFGAANYAARENMLGTMSCV